MREHPTTEFLLSTTPIDTRIPRPTAAAKQDHKQTPSSIAPHYCRRTSTYSAQIASLVLQQPSKKFESKPHSASADMDDATSTSPQQNHSSDDNDSLLGLFDAVPDFDPRNPSHRCLLASEVDVEADAEHSDMTELGAPELHAVLISNNEWATQFLYLQAEPWDRAMSIYKLLEMERRYMHEQLYNERMLNITISNGTIEMEVELRRNEPLSEHI